MAQHFQKKKGFLPSSEFFSEEQPKVKDVTPVITDDTIHRGVITTYFTDRGYGFITSKVGRIFFAVHEVISDVVGRKRMFVDCEVEFQLATKGGRVCAAEIRCLGVGSVDPEAYRETSTVVKWSPEYGNGYARRPDGGTVSLAAADIISEGIESLAPGSRIYHGVQQDGRFWAATNIEIYHPEPLELEPAPPESEPTWDAVVADVTPIPHAEVIEIPKPAEAKRSILMDPRYRNRKLRDLKIRRVA